MYEANQSSSKWEYQEIGKRLVKTRNISIVAPLATVELLPANQQVAPQTIEPLAEPCAPMPIVLPPGDKA